MTVTQQKNCPECGAVLLPKRRVCVACAAPVGEPVQERNVELAEAMRELPSTREPDKTVVFVPEMREARLKRERRSKQLVIAALTGLVAMLVVSLVVWWFSPRKKTVVPKPQPQREAMAKRDLDLYAKAFEEFRADIGRYPTVQEGFGALLKAPGGVANWHGPYIEADYSVDPWGHDYVYQSLDDGKNFVMFTFGPEGESAGRYYLRIGSALPQPNASPIR